MKTKKKSAPNNLTVGLVNDFLGTTEQPPVTKESLQNELRNLLNECYHAIAEPAKLSGLLRNVQFYNDNLDSETFKLLSNLTEILVKDLTQFQTELVSIEAEQNDILNSSDDVEEIQVSAFSVSNRYAQWMEQYTSVVLPVTGDISAIMNQAVRNADDKKNAVSETPEVTTNVPSDVC